MKKIIIAALMSCFAAVPAVAADTNFYLGVKLGSVSNSVPGMSQRSNGFGIFDGYTINPNLAVEVAYTDLGNAELHKITFFALELSAVGSYPINQQLSLFGKLGLARTYETGWGMTARRIAPTLGLGGQFNINPSVGVRLGWDRYAFGDNHIWKEGHSNLYSIAGVFKL